MHSYHNVAKLRQFHGVSSLWQAGRRATPGAHAPSTAAAIDLNVQIADLLAEGIAVEPQKVGRPDLIAAGRCQCCGEQRHLDFLEDAMIETRRRHAVGETRKMRR